MPLHRYSIFFLLSLTTFCVLSSPCVLYAEEAWETFRVDDDIKVYSRSVEGCSENEFKATTIIDQPLEVIGAVLLDVPSYKKWVDKCETVMTLHEPKPLNQIVYFTVNAPWPISDRDVIYDIHTVVDQKSGKMIVKANALKEYLVPENDGHVRVKDAQYVVILEKVSDNRTQMVYTCRLNAGGDLHSYAANLISGDIIYNSIKNLRKITPEFRFSNVVNRYRHYFVDNTNSETKSRGTISYNWFYHNMTTK